MDQLAGEPAFSDPSSPASWSHDRLGPESTNGGRAAAEAAAKEAAKAKVQEILQEDRIQKLVRESANAMFAKGEFRQATEEQVRAQLPSAIATETGKRIPEQVNGELERRGLLYRMVSAQVAQEFGPQLHRFAGKKIEIYTTLLPEPSAFSDSIRKLFRANGLEAEIVYGGNSDHPTVVAPDDNLANILVDLLTRASGEQPQKLKAPEAFGTGIAAAIEIPERRPVKK